MAERRTDSDTPTLPPGVLAYLVHGWEGVQPGMRGALRALLLTDQEKRDAYLQHRAAIDAEARRCGLVRPWVVEQEASIREEYGLPRWP